MSSCISQEYVVTRSLTVRLQRVFASDRSLEEETNLESISQQTVGPTQLPNLAFLNNFDGYTTPASMVWAATSNGPSFYD